MKGVVIYSNGKAVAKNGTAMSLSDANLIPKNIKKDVTIFGVTGELEGGEPLVCPCYVTKYDSAGNPIEAKNINTTSIPSNMLAAKVDGATSYPNMYRYLKKFTVTPGTTRILSGAFCGCTGLQEIVLPEGLTRIESGTSTLSSGQNTFQNCNLQKIKLPSTLAYITGASFYRASQTGITEIEIDSLESYLQLSVPTTLYGIIGSANLNITGLDFNPILIINGEPMENYIGKLSHNPRKYFLACLNIKNIDTGELTSLPDYAFYSIRNTENINMPNIESLVGDNFTSGRIIKKITMNKLKTIGSYCFYELDLIKSIKFSDITSIGAYCFMRNKAIEYYDFSANTSVPSLNTGCFTENYSKNKIVVPDELYDTWVTATNWTALESRIVKSSEFFTPRVISGITDKLVNMGDDAIYNIEYISIPDLHLNCIFDKPTSLFKDVKIEEMDTGYNKLSFSVTTRDVEEEINCNIIITSDSDESINLSYNSVITATLKPSITNLSTSYGFVEMTSPEYIGWYESNNQGVHSSYALCQANITINTPKHLYVDYISSGEKSCDYGIISKLNSNLSKSTTGDTSSTVVMKNSSAEPSLEIKTLDYGVVSANCYIQFKYRKDGSANSGNDSLRFRIRLEFES